MDGGGTGETASLPKESNPRESEAINAWLWGNKTIANVTLNLRSQHDQVSTCVCEAPTSTSLISDHATDEHSPSAKRQCISHATQSSSDAEQLAGSSNTPAGAPVACQPSPTNPSYMLHDVVLTSASGYFRAIIAGSGTTVMAGKGWCPTCRVATLTLSEPELNVAPLVLRFMYTLQLLTDNGLLPDAMQLVWMIQVAEFLDMASCIKACTQSLKALSDDLFPISAVFLLPTEFHIRADIKELAAEAEFRLLHIFGDAFTVINDAALRKRLCELPSTAITALLTSSKFHTDSEASVLLLLAFWYKANAGTCTAEQLTELKQWVRYSRLDPMFICSVLKQMPDFCPTWEQSNMLWMFSATDSVPDNAGTTILDGACPESWFLPERPCRVGAQRSFQMQLKIPEAELLSHLELVAKMRGGGVPPERISSGCTLGCGYDWELSFVSRTCETPLELHLSVRPPLGMERKVQVIFTTEVNGPSQSELDHFVFSSTNKIVWENSDNLGNADQVLGGDASLGPWKEHMVDGSLIFSVEVSVPGKAK